MRTTVLMLALSLAASSATAAQPEPTDHPEYAVVKRVVEDTICWAMTKDLDRLLRIFAEDDLLLWWVSSGGGATGTADLKGRAETVWMTDDFEATRCEFRDVRIRFSSDGTVAWFSCRFDDCGTWKGDSFCLENVRKTGVLEKRDGQWTIVQSHASWPIDALPDDVVDRVLARRAEEP